MIELTKYYVDTTGKYLGGWQVGIPQGSLNVDFFEVANPPEDSRQIYIDGCWGELNDAQTYSENRRVEYPEIGDQLDMLWHAMNDDETKRLEPFYSTIKTVKDKYPKE